MTVLGLSSEIWQILANIATILGIAAFLFTLLATRSQLVEMGRVRSLTAFIEVHKLLESLEERDHLRKYFYNLTGEPGKLKDADQDKVYQIIRNMDIVAYLVKKDYVALNDFLELYFTVVCRMWIKAKPFIYFEREKRGDSEWGTHFEWLGEKAEQFRTAYHPEVTIAIFSREDMETKKAGGE